jgi:hypothetical protein
MLSASLLDAGDAAGKDPPMRTLALALCMALAVNASAQVYKWVDAQGRVQYSDQPPPDAKTQRLKIRNSGQTEKVPTAAAPSATPDIAAGMDPKLKQRNCQTARQNVAALRSGLQVEVVGADGKTSTLDEAAIKAEVARAEAEVARFCN